MNLEEHFSGTYINAEFLDSHGGRAVRAINNVVVEEMQNGEHRPVLIFSGTDKKLIIRPTVFAQIKAIFGTAETDHWIGQSIELYTEPTTYGGKPTRGVRVRQVGSVPAQVAAPAQQAQAPLSQPTNGPAVAGGAVAQPPADPAAPGGPLPAGGEWDEVPW